MIENSMTQTRSVADDRPCAACGYNLRGQTATWDRATSRWRATCPECGTAQDAASGAAADARASLTTVVCIVASLYVAWTLLTWLAFGQASIVSVVKASALRSNTTGRNGDYLVDSLPEMLAHVTVHGTRLALCGVGFGMLASLAPRATVAMRTLLACVPVAVASVVGMWFYFVGWVELLNDPTVSAAILLGRFNTQAGLQRGEWTFVLAMSVIGGLIAIAAARLGAAIGLRVATFVASCFAPSDRWPAFLVDRNAR